MYNGKINNITMTDIAQRVGVSQATVSRVLSNHPRINKKTKNVVMEAVRELGYKHVALSEASAVKLQTTIGLVMCPLPEQTNPLGMDFFSELVSGVQSVASKNNIELVMTTLPSNAESLNAGGISPERAAGILLLGYPSEKLTSSLREKKIKYVIISGDDYEDDRSNIVTTNNLEGSVTTCRYLLSNGHQRIGFIMSKLDSFRMTGFELEMMRHKRTIAEEDIHIVESTDISSFIEMIHNLIKLGNLPSALVISFYDAAKAVKTLLNLNGLKVPEDISIVSFKHRPADTDIPCVMVPPYELGKKGLSRLIELMNNPDDTPHRITVPMKACFE